MFILPGESTPCQSPLKDLIIDYMWFASYNAKCGKKFIDADHRSRPKEAQSIRITPWLAMQNCMVFGEATIHRVFVQSATRTRRC
jgi:hypothetical protein